MPRIIDVVEWPNESANEILHREPQNGPGDFRLGSQVIVRESQTAVFFRDGKALDTFSPGRHTIETSNIPVLATLIGLVTSGKTPFPAEVVFVSMRQFLDQKWGTPEAIPFRDPDFGMARLRAFGSYAFSVKNPQTFVNKIAGQQGLFTNQQIEAYFRGIVVQRFMDILGEQKHSLLDLPAHYNELSASLQDVLIDDFNALGLNMLAMFVTAITPTEETARAIDERAAMGAIGDMDTYMKFKAARAMGDAANNPGSDMGAGIGLGAGAGMGLGMAQMIGQSMQSKPAEAAPAAAPSGPLTKAQVQEAIDALDLRFSKGEIAEETYNRLMAKWETRLTELG